MVWTEVTTEERAELGRRYRMGESMRSISAVWIRNGHGDRGDDGPNDPVGHEY